MAGDAGQTSQNFLHEKLGINRQKLGIPQGCRFECVNFTHENPGPWTVPPKSRLNLV